MKALILLAAGCEEMEAVIVMDTLRRGGVEVVAAGLAEGPLTASRGVVITPDIALDALENAKDFDVLILPGGLPGTEALREDPRVRDLLLAYTGDATRRVAAVCAAPTVLDGLGLLEGLQFTCYPGLKARCAGGGTWVDAAVVEDGNLITSQGPGTSFAFALRILERLAGGDAAGEVAAGMLVGRF
ncbi:MAG: DJ-1/PfpI family protein [Verrucomicrobia bacterium]|nr:DJ-1/PfpI family protein [Verrucomicrobiota bacterium]MCH8528849.1 DJ-1/PfpI family protein [Kiritimatiellia bacterium]